MKDVNARLLAPGTATAAVTGSAFSLQAPGTPYEGIPIHVRIPAAAGAVTSNSLTVTVRIDEATATGGTWTTNYTFPTIGISSGAATAYLQTKRITTRKAYLRAVVDFTAGSTGPAIPYAVEVVTADVT